MTQTRNHRAVRIGVVAAFIAVTSFAASGIASAQTGYQLDSVTPSNVAPGGSVTVHSNDWCVGGSVTVTLQPGIVLGTLVANGNGIIDGSVAIPANTSTGSHNVALTGQGHDCSTTRTQVFGINVVSSASTGSAGGLAGKALAFTGGNVGTLLAIGVAAVIVGATALVGARRRRATLSG